MSLTTITCPCGARLEVNPRNVYDRLAAERTVHEFQTLHAEHGSLFGPTGLSPSNTSPDRLDSTGEEKE